MAKIDILLPYWGDFELLKKTVESVFAQTETDWHLSVFDDAYPTDEAKKYFATIKDLRVTYVKHKKNIGITHNFNFALSKVAADYFVMLGCDDVLLPNYIELSIAEIGKADFYQPKVEIIDEHGDLYLPLVDKVKAILTPKPGLHRGESLAVSLCNGNWLYFPSILWRTSSVTPYGFDNNYKIAEDLNLELQLVLDGATLQLGKVPAFQYRRFAHSLSSKEKKKGGIRFNEEDDVYENFVQKFKNANWKKAARAARLRITSRLHQLTSR